MQVGGEDQRHAEHGEKIADQNALLVLRRVNGGDEAETELLRHDRARDLQGRHCEPRRQPKHRADDDLLEQERQHGRKRLHVDAVSLLVCGEENDRQNEGDGEPHARGQRLLAQAWHQHDHGADARKSEKKCNRQGWQK